MNEPQVVCAIAVFVACAIRAWFWHLERKARRLIEEIIRCNVELEKAVGRGDMADADRLMARIDGACESVAPMLDVSRPD